MVEEDIDPAAEAPETAPVVTAAATERRRGPSLARLREPRGLAVLGFVLAAAFAVLSVLLYLQSTDLRAEAAAREAALEAGEVMALRVTTFDGATIDQWVADTQALATGAYADQVAALFDQEIRQGLAAGEVRSVGEITSSFVQDVDGDAATVFAVLRQTFTSTAQQQPVSDELRMEIDLVLVQDEWLASDVAVLGPSVISPVQGGADGAAPTEPAPTEPAPTEDSQ